MIKAGPGQPVTSITEVEAIDKLKKRPRETESKSCGKQRERTRQERKQIAFKYPSKFSNTSKIKTVYFSWEKPINGQVIGTESGRRQRKEGQSVGFHCLHANHIFDVEILQWRGIRVVTFVTLQHHLLHDAIQEQPVLHCVSAPLI